MRNLTDGIRNISGFNVALIGDGRNSAAYCRNSDGNNDFNQGKSLISYVASGFHRTYRTRLVTAIPCAVKTSIQSFVNNSKMNRYTNFNT